MLKIISLLFLATFVYAVDLGEVNVSADIEIEVKGHINIGDKGGSDQVYNKKNVVKTGKIKGGGDFNLGDMR